MSRFGIPTTGAPAPLVNIAPPSIARHQTATWNGIEAEIVQVIRYEPFDYEFKSSRHLLTATECAARYDGETLVDGLPPSHLRDFSRKMTFIPAGHRFYGWQKPRDLTRTTFLYIDPHSIALDPELRFAETEFKPRLFFFDRDLWETALKLKAQVENPGLARRAYAEALGIALAHELVRMNSGIAPVEPSVRGGLAGWQQKKVTEYIEEHLAEDIPLSTLARLVQLSPYHFARAFKQSFGMPPHRYHTSRRMERAKILLAKAEFSITEIGLNLGFSETSSFTAAFRRLTGGTPTDYRRKLE
jgi:AraC family transcriptional regulator